MNERENAVTDECLKEAHQPKLLTKAEVAAYARCTTRCIDNWMRRGYLPYFKIGRTVRFKSSDVDAYLRENFRVERRKNSAGVNSQM